jgi:hypothetical protein
MRIFKGFNLIVWLTLLVLSCGPKYVFKPIRVNPPFDSSFIKKIAVIEFSNYSGTPGAGKIIADKVEQFLVYGGSNTYKVITRMELDHILREYNLRAIGILNSTTAKKIGKLAGVDAIIIGNVQNYKVETSRWVKNPGYGPAITVFKRTATVSFSIKVINTMTGEVVWSDNAHGAFWREASEDSLRYLEEYSEYDYFQVAVKKAMYNHVRSLFPVVEWVKVRVKKNKSPKN